jgi:hypothetical protein
VYRGDLRRHVIPAEASSHTVTVSDVQPRRLQKRNVFLLGQSEGSGQTRGNLLRRARLVRLDLAQHRLGAADPPRQLHLRQV